MSIIDNYVSKCCWKPLKVEGNVTHYYTCTGCGKGTDSRRKEAIVGVNQQGEVRALFCIDSEEDEKEAARVKIQWEQQGRSVHRCSQKYAFSITKWVEE